VPEATAMPRIEIDGQAVEVEEGLTVIQAADQLNLEIPHYCYHPGLSIAGNCRMCLVEIERMPKLQIACNTRVLDGMVVRTASPKVKVARQAVLEFLLLNHPIDCPVCDQAGECKLQDYYMDYGRYRSRMPLERKVRKGKVLDIGPHVVLDQERCILCTRCTRFLDEVTHTSELGIFERGDHCEIDLAPGQRLDNPYSANVVEVCPVGALTSKDFRFQARVWYLEHGESVCAACSRGCSVDVYHRRNQVFRFRPRYNPAVNDWWMCDEGRASFAAHQSERRLTQPLLRGDDGFRPVGWESALDGTRDRLARIRTAHGDSTVAALVSARAPTEEAFLLGRLVGAEAVHGLAWSPPGATGDDFLIRADKNPNTRGLEILGIEVTVEGVKELLEAVRVGDVRALVILRTDLVAWLGEEQVREALEAAELVVVVDTDMSETAAYADIVLPIAAHLETDGTFANCDGQIQALRRTHEPPGEARPGWRVLDELCRRSGLGAGHPSAASVFDEMAARCAPLRGLTFAGLGPHGARVSLPDAGRLPRAAAAEVGVPG
jgi:NADH-quinone oxidoreductase subunit G